jgi:iron-sulfur cluster assembly protein
MLTLTENASTIVKDIASRSGGGPDNGLRISTEAASDTAFTVTAADRAEPGDQVVEQDGATVYLAPPAVEKLDGMVLDAGVDQAGNIQFSLAQQT